MTNITHPEMVAALVKPGTEIAANMTPAEADLWHGATGVEGEAGELLECLYAGGRFPDRENFVEELGDIEFYLEQVRSNLGIERGDTVKRFFIATSGFSSLDIAIHLSIAASRLLDQAKKVAIYKKPADLPAFKDALNVIEWALEALRAIHKVSRQTTLDANIEKLSARYQGLQYSDAAAQTRADKLT